MKDPNSSARFFVMVGYPIATLLGYFLIYYRISFTPIFIPIIGNLMMIFGFNTFRMRCIKPISFISGIMMLSNIALIVAYLLYAFYELNLDNAYYLNELCPDSIKPLVGSFGKEVTVLAYLLCFGATAFQSISFGYIASICKNYNFLRARAANLSSFIFVKSMLYLFVLLHGLGFVGDLKLSGAVIITALFLMDLLATLALRATLYSPLFESVAKEDRGEIKNVAIPMGLFAVYIAFSVIILIFTLFYKFIG